MRTTLLLAFFSMLLMIGSENLIAATIFTDADGADSEIINPGNWDNGLPTNDGTNPGTIPTGLAATADLDLDSLTSKEITLEGTATLTGLNVRVEDSTITLKDASSYATTGTVALGRDASPVGDTVLNIMDSASLSMTAGFKVGLRQNAFLNQSGGSVVVATEIDLGNMNNGGVGLYTISGGTVTANDITFQNGSAFDFTAGSTGVLTILGGGNDFSSNLEAFVTNGDISLGGATSPLSNFLISYDGQSTSIQLAAIPEPSAVITMLGAVGTLYCVSRRVGS